MIKQNLVGIYGIEDIETGNIYIGQSTDIAKRWSNHSTFLKNNEHNYIELQEAFNLDKDRIKYTMLQEREDFWFKYIRQIDGWTLINKQKHGGKHNTRVKDTSRMKAAQRGEKNGNARLKEEDVIEIKKYLNKGVSVKELSEQFGVSKNHICNIKNGKKWRNII